MSTRTTYTSTISVPTYASWKCEKCGEVNFSAGIIRCSRQASTSSFRNSKHEEAKAEASNLAQAEWAGYALEIMLNPNQNAAAIRNDFFLQNTNCTKCGAKPKWDKNMKYLAWFGLCFISAVISGIVAFAMQTSIVAWLLFLGLLSVIIFGFVSESQYKKMMANLPKRYTPVIGSLNADVIEYANHRGKSIPTPDETIEIVRNNDIDTPSFAAGNSSAFEKENASFTPKDNASPSIVKESSQSIFCRKCGAQLPADSDFCNKCGTGIIR